MSVVRRNTGAGRWRWVVAGGLAVVIGIVISLFFRDNEPGERSVEQAPPRRPSMNRRGVTTAGEVELRPEAEPRTVPRMSPAGTNAETTSDETMPEFEGYLFRTGLVVDERVKALQGLRGQGLSRTAQSRALAFLAGKEWPADVTASSMHWLADELLTVLRLQQPSQSDLVDRLAEVASLSTTDPVIRDYLMQHLGHLWEQQGGDEKIEAALWAGTKTSDESTPGTALIALRNGYAREGRDEELGEVRKRSFELARNEDSPLATRVTALGIAGESGDAEVIAFARTLEQAEGTPAILRKVAAHLLER